MNQFVFANNVQTTLAAAITSASQTVIELSSTANLPTIPAGYMWALTLNDAATQTFFEIVYVTSISGGNLTVLRGQENTVARTWSVNDLAYACATAGTLQSFLSAAQAGNFVELSPATQQTGFIDVSGALTAGGLATFGAGVTVAAGLSVAQTGSFGDDLNASRFISEFAYANTAIGNLALQMHGSASIIGIGPSSGLAVNGITASALAIGASATGKFIAIDTGGNLAASGSLFGENGYFNSSCTALEFLQNGVEVVDTIASPGNTITISKSGGTIDIDVRNSGQVALGGTIVNDGNGGDPSLSLPNYGQWFVEVIYGLTQTSNTDMTLTLSHIGGTITGGFLSNANGVTAFNSNAWITLYGKGHTTVNNQTLTFGLTASGGSFDASNQPWTVRATRTA